jgi:hypothetical protein
VVQSGALNELLFREAIKLTSRNLMSAFKGTGGGERPARSALSLVLDGSDSSFSDPVDFSIVCSGCLHAGSFKIAFSSRAALFSFIPSRARSSLSNASVLRDGRCNISIESLLLANSPGGHEVMSQRVGGVQAVVSVNLSIGNLEKFSSEVEFLNSSV